MAPCLLAVALLWVAVELNRSSWNTGQWVERQQPVQFSHKHHVGDDGIDCRYCHTSVETSSSAGLPSTTTCMNCHKQIWADSPYLEPVRASFRTGKPIEWIRVHDLPDYAYFNHSIHVKKGVGCSTCHGRIDDMPILYQAAITTDGVVFGVSPRAGKIRASGREDLRHGMAAGKQDERGTGGRVDLKARYKIQGRRVLESCSTCHR